MSTRDALFLAFVLHRRDHGNTSLLLEVLGVGHGRFPAIAKGARRAKSTASALLQPFQPLWLAVAGRGEVRVLAKVEGAGPSIALQGRALVGGFYLNELLTRLLGRHDPHDALFAFYQLALTGLADGRDLDSVLRQFELRLLDEIGYGMVLDRLCSDGSPIRPDLSYVYEVGSGVRPIESSRAGPVISGATLLALVTGEPLAPAQCREARLLLRSALAPHLGDRPLQSRELYRRWFSVDE